MTDHFDVFLSHNSHDKPAVIALARKLKAHGLKVWLDAWELRPGQPWQEALEQIIETTQTAAVLVGNDGFGPWQSREMRGCLSEFAEHGKAVVPVLLPSCPTDVPKLPFFLKQLTWVDLRDGKEEQGFYHLIWGITGKKPKELEDAEEENLIVPAIQTLIVPTQEAREREPIPHIHGWPSDKVQALQRDTAQSLGLATTFRDALQSGGEGPLLAVIPAGSYLMGSPDDEPERYDDEGPRHTVSFSKPFAIGVYAVTFDEYDRYCKAVKKSLVRDQAWGRGRQPVINVSWEDAAAYCAWLTGQTGKQYRLPTEAEWEYACRAGTDTPFYFGTTISAQQANFNRDTGSTVSVDKFQPNAFGLYQMHGNVWEWCEDGKRKYSEETQIDPVGPTGAARVVRGGSWFNLARDCRSAYRRNFAPDDRDYDTGFCCARVQS
ncbi:MAG: hypothetical protein DM484_14475 [Candidatus Methylumidiphilus alinenensis]|uniref:TIR domain-containing protein n=1 Tax=Candidatus Methylumidiphilus alinenensis TaxID=2202197 RepID=A0A2W4R0A0_9GAMM|nr:MAG: hypothetical protein DM484_14475 [Candidatus Methylumidiphilus alinenensis]